MGGGWPKKEKATRPVGQVKIADFGCSKWVQPGEAVLEAGAGPFGGSRTLKPQILAASYTKLVVDLLRKRKTTKENNQHGYL